MKLALGNANNFCFLHGRAHIPETLQGALTKETSCTASASDVRITHYYIWLHSSTKIFAKFGDFLFNWIPAWILAKFGDIFFT